MNRGVWVAAVALGLGGMLSDVAAQETSWRPVQRPAAAGNGPRARAASEGSAGVTLGRPVPIMRGSSAVLQRQPGLFPPAYRDSASLPAGNPAPAGSAQAIAVVPPPGAVIAASARPVPAPGG